MRYDPDRPVVEEEWWQLGKGEQKELGGVSSTGAHPASKPCACTRIWTVPAFGASGSRRRLDPLDD